MEVRIDARIGQRHVGQSIGARAEIDVIVFELAAPRPAEREFDAPTGNPAQMHARFHGDNIAIGIIEIDMGSSICRPAGDVGQHRSKCVSDATADGAKIIERGVEWCRREFRPIQRARKRYVRFDTER